VSSVYFNLNPALDAGLLSINCISGSGSVTQPWFTQVTDGSRVGGGDLARFRLYP
jgi:hypothetical protein